MFQQKMTYKPLGKPSNVSSLPRKVPQGKTSLRARLLGSAHAKIVLDFGAGRFNSAWLVDHIQTTTKKAD